MTFTSEYVEEAIAVLRALDQSAVEACAPGLADVRSRGGRLFVLGVGGSAGHASHAVNDFRKLCDIEAYAPTDNVSELTARINDEGWETAFVGWLRGSRLDQRDGLLVFSVGGGDRERGISANLVSAMELARQRSSAIFAVVGRDGGFAARVADACVVVPPLYPDRVTPHTEGLCAVVWHLLVSHPLLATEPDEVGGPREGVRERSGLSRVVRRRVGPASSGAISSTVCSPRAHTESVTVFDNFSSGRQWHLAQHAEDARLHVVHGEATELDQLTEAMRDSDAVIHLASNPDIARAATEPSIDFDSGTVLTHHVVEAMRRSGVPRILYASGSGVYGDLGDLEATEDHGPLLPISTYGASKLAGEALISSYCSMFGLTGMRVPLRQRGRSPADARRGVRLRARLLEDPGRLTILGDGESEQVLRACHRRRRRRAPGRPAGPPGAVRSTTWPPVTTSPCARSPTWPSTAVGLDPSEYGVRVHRGRPRMERRHPGREAEYRSHPPPGLEQRPCRRRRRCGRRSNRWSNTFARGQLA